MHVTAHLDLDLVAVESTDTVSLLLEIEAPPSPSDGSTPDQGVIVVLDRSGSMGSGRLHAAKRALHALIDRLRGGDTIGIVVFDDQARAVVPAVRINDIGRAQLHSAVDTIHPGGMTDLSSGYSRGLQEARTIDAPGGTTLLLLSDGHANSGITDPVVLRGLAEAAAADRVTTATIGIGTDYDDRILSEMAIGGRGNHTFAEDGDSAAGAVTGEIDGLLDKSVQAASLFIRPTQPLTVSAVRIVNDLPSAGAPGGVVVELGDMYGAETRRLVVEIDVPALQGLGLTTVADLELRYVSLPDLQAHTITLPVSVNVVPGDVAAGRVPNPEVVTERLLLTAQRDKREAEEALRRGDVGAARQWIDDVRASLRTAPAFAPDVEEELAFLEELSDEVDRDSEFTSKRLSSSRTKKTRGFRRLQGGERTLRRPAPGKDGGGAGSAGSADGASGRSAPGNGHGNGPVGDVGGNIEGGPADADGAGSTELGND